MVKAPGSEAAVCNDANALKAPIMPKDRGAVKRVAKKKVSRKKDDASGDGSIDGVAQQRLHSPHWNTSMYRGVTKHRRSGRWEAHIWVRDQNKQVYLGGYEKEEHAAEAYDMAALKTKGFSTLTNFDKERYKDLKDCLGSASLEEVVTAVRRQSQGFSRGTSSFRGVSPHPSGRFEARIGIAGNKHVYLGLFDEEPSAARAYDRAVVRIKGAQASTNFTLSDYRNELEEHRLKCEEMLALNVSHTSAHLLPCCTTKSFAKRAVA